MLSIAPIKSSGAAVSYYEADDYYAAGSTDKPENEGGSPEAQGQWYGAGAESLGLSGGVERDSFKDILDGNLPNGAELGTIRGGERVHTPGWDMTFSAPKSVSVMAEVGGDSRLLEAHDNAVKEALAWTESNNVAYREKTIGGERVTSSGNIVAALFQHDTSRELDPQLHTHAVVINATERADGEWRSVHSRPLFDAKMAAGNVYRAALSREVQSLGYEVTQTHSDGRFELKDVPNDVNREYSTRRKEIESALDERGLEGAKASAKAAVMTRSTKQHVPRNELLPGWTEKAEALGFNAVKGVESATAKGTVTHGQAVSADRAVDVAIKRLSTSEAAFTHNDLIRWSMAAGVTAGVTTKEVDDVINARRESGELVKAEADSKRGWTTARALGAEAKVLSSNYIGRNDVKPVYGQRQWNRAEVNTQLNNGQQDAVKVIVTARDRVVGVVGRPGSGKTFMVSEAARLLEDKGYRVIGMAQNAEAAAQLSKDGNIEAGTLDKHLNNAGREIAQHRKQRTYNSEKQVWIVDEASQVNTGRMRRLLTAAEKLDARVVLVGDPKQLGAIESGKPYDQLMRAGMVTAEMDEIRRQKDQRQLGAVRSTIEGNIGKALDKLSPDTKEIEAKTDRLAEMVRDWRNGTDEEREKTLLLTSTNKDRRELNESVRAVLRAEGSLGQEHNTSKLVRVSADAADKLDAVNYQKGDLLVFSRKVKSAGVAKGDYWKVKGVDVDKNVLTIANDKTGIEQQFSTRAGGVQSAEVWRPEESTVAIGEVIKWTKNDAERGLRNGQTLNVESVKGSEMVLSDKDGSRVDINTADPKGQHWNHNHASTIYSAQGKTERTALVNIDSDSGKLLNQQAFLVAVSRQTDEIKLYMDDRAGVQKSLEKQTGEKTSGIDSRQQAATRAARESYQRMARDWPKQREQQPKDREFER